MRQPKTETTMEQLPNWLEMTVFAAGITAFADELLPLKKETPASPEVVPPPLH